MANRLTLIFNKSALIDGYDSIVTNIPGDAGVVFGYTSGSWPTYFQFVNLFKMLAKRGLVKSIAVNAAHDADFLDVENGDATPEQAAAWVERQLARGLKKPGIYASVSTFAQILSLLAAAGIHRDEIIVWTAHYGKGRHICDQSCGFGFPTTADGTQWTSTAHNMNLDADVFFASSLLKTKQPDFHYDWYYDDPAFPERRTVVAYDKLRNQPLSRIIPNRPKLKQYRLECEKLAERVTYEATVKHPNKDGSPSWQDYHRGFRNYRLRKRANGDRVNG